MNHQPKLNLLVLRSTDPDNAVIFYKALGLQFVQHRHGQGPEHYSSTGGGPTLEIYPSTKKQTPIRLGFKVDDVVLLVKNLLTMDIEVRTLPTDSPWGKRAVVLDLDGNVVELTQDTE